MVDVRQPSTAIFDQQREVRDVEGSRKGCENEAASLRRKLRAYRMFQNLMASIRRARSVRRQPRSREGSSNRSVTASWRDWIATETRRNGARRTRQTLLPKH